MIAEGKVRGPGKDAIGTTHPLRFNPEGATITSVGAGKYSDLVLADKVFAASSTAAVAHTADVTLAFTGLVLENPTTSDKDYTLLSVSWAQTVATPAAGLLGLMTGVDAGDAAIGITPRNRLIGSVITSDAVVDVACTLVGTPVREMFLATIWAEATTAGSQQPVTVVDINGLIVLKPGSYVATYAAVAETAAFWWTFVWAEEKAQ